MPPSCLGTCVKSQGYEFPQPELGVKVEGNTGKFFHDLCGKDMGRMDKLSAELKVAQKVPTGCSCACQHSQTLPCRSDPGTAAPPILLRSSGKWDCTGASPAAGIGRCAVILLLAVLCDVIGLIILFVGIFAPLSSWDFFVYLGSLLLAFSLLFWIFWYTFNIEVPFRELGFN
ncbi:PREDICTED: transmembrane protein 238 [Apaloderma vittatum]|uniref:transmembrane protein 238 n=1 Tax=Apaloderma vittatum TaxID=57397 RepID=UPI0005219D73|nr:PREDICTED: transmembrane protein 238 [Apaloderma vittatum]